MLLRLSSGIKTEEAVGLAFRRTCVMFKISFNRAREDEDRPRH